MKKMLLLTAMMTASALAVERKDLLPLIEIAATNRESAYVEMRNKIVEYGKDALPVLDALVKDDALPWQQQLAVLVCKERIERKPEIEKLLSTDWRKHPDFNPDWNKYIMGPDGCIANLIVAPALRELGLWGYCLEVEWKATGETGKLSDWNNEGSWAGLCSTIVKDNPEKRVWYLKVCADLIANASSESPSPRWLTRLYTTLLRERSPDVADMIEKYDAKFPSPPPLPPEARARMGAGVTKAMQEFNELMERQKAQTLRPPAIEN